MPELVQGLHLTKVHQVGGEQIRALNDVSLEIFPGEMVGIWARGGSGKSTLLHVLGCLQKPDSGRVTIDGQDCTELGEEELERVRAEKIGFLFEAFNLLPDETVLANVEIPLRNQGIDAYNSRVQSEGALETVGLGNRADHRPGQLSARQRQCVAIARALANDPAVIFADEPTKGLDSTSREEILGLLQKLNGDGRTIVISTTESGVATYCRRLVRMRDGKTTEDRLVTKRRIIPLSRIPGPPPESEVREEQAVCSRYNHGNPQEAEKCQRCDFPLHLTPEEQESIEVRLSRKGSRWMGVESATDEGQIPGQELIDDLKEIPLFAGLGSKSLVKLLPALEELHYSNGTTIVKQGDEGDSFYIVRTGNVQVLVEREGRPATPIAGLGPNEGFGEMALLTDQPRFASVVATSDVDMWRLSKAAFEELVSDNLSLSIYFNRILAQRFKALQERLYPSG